MKRLFLFFIFSFILSISWAQNSPTRAKFRYLTNLEPDESCYTFTSGGMVTTICKGDDASQLYAYGPKEMWLGKNSPGVDYSEIVITFSKPVSSVNFVMSHFNNDQNTGDEQVDEFHIFTENKTEINNYTFNWSTGSKAYPFSAENWTTADPVKHVIKGTKDAFGEQASGSLTLSSNTPFTRIAFRHAVLRGQPNGIIINDAINYTVAPDSIVKQVKADTLLTKKTEPTLTPLTDTIQLTEVSKEEIVTTTEIKKDSVLLVKEEVKPIKQEKKIVPLKKTVVKKTIPSIKPIKKVAVVPVKKIPPPHKKVIQIPPAKKAVQKKAITVQATPEKKIVTLPKSPVKKEDSLMTYKLSQIKQLKVGEKIKLERVYFKQSLSQLLPTSYPELDTLVDILKQYPTLEIELQGHTDNQGVAVLNQKLSEERVDAVKQYLVSKGVSATRLTGKGFGSSRPFMDNESEEHRYKNRRVEFMITKR